uniref:YceG family protein n=1 Tax=Eubacterium cellulosolvens TaxID=29322 RepID=UPI0004859241|nr:YceG family protein [[Eubacterium] cellulosolvens]
MLDHKRIESLDDYFKRLDERKEKAVYFYRINGYNELVDRFITDYYEAARKSGVIIEGRIPNPDEKNLAYYEEMMGMSFQMSVGFISSSLVKWLPRMNAYQRDTVATSIYDCLDSLRKAGKNENMLKNAYIKFMCWLYYKFERIVGQLGNQDVPKILYEGEISNYELMLISILSNAGCDVVLLQYKGDANYLKLDPGSTTSDELRMQRMSAFPQDFSLKKVREAIQEAFNNRRLYGGEPKWTNCTNAWMKDGNVLEQIRTPAPLRGSDPNLFYNCFCRVNGVDDKLTYPGELYRLYTDLEKSNRRVVIVDGEIPVPTMEEIGSVHRKNAYERPDQLILDLSGNLIFAANNDIQMLIRKAFADTLLEASKAEGMNLHKLTNKAVYLVCWLKRYLPRLFSNRKEMEIGCFVHFGACRNDNEAALIRIIGRLPVDTLVLVPDRNETCVLTDSLLYEQNCITSMNVPKFPKEPTDLQVGTSAYHAERELDAIMYQDTGIYRNQQYAKADAVSLKTMYEEIQILWKEEVKYRPNFSTVDGIVTIPVIFSKVSGVKDGDLNGYWNSIKELMKEDVFLITRVPYVDSMAPNPMKAFSTEFFKNGKLQREKIKNHRSYPYGFMREDMQDHILDKLQLLIDQKVIKGTFENGTEYTIVATVLNLSKEIIRILQKFDFTKKNPKLIYINTGEKMISLEDAIIVAFLNLVGFDIVFFVPTGYQSVENHYNKKIFEEHQIGEYVYDLQIPDLHQPQTRTGSWLNIFKRG